MKKRYHIVLSMLAVGILSLACSLLTTPATPPTLTPPAVQEITSAPPTVEPSQVPQTSDATRLPAGLVTATEDMVTFYDLDGAQVSQVQLPQFTFPQQDRFHVAGPMPSSGAAAPLLYFSFDNEEALHFRDGNGQIFSLLNGTSFLGLTGVPGEPIVALSQIEYLDVNLRSQIYAGSVQTLTSAAPISVIDDPESWAIKPILVEAENGAPTEVWYSRIAYGIGGDIVFEPRKGLFVLDLATGQARTILENSLSPWAISTDRNWIAYSTIDLPLNTMCIKDLASGAEACFPAMTASEGRGAGDAVLSPDAGYVAWMEGDGWQMAEVPSFTATVRVGQNDGTIVADLPMNTFESIAGVGPVSRAEPVGWLDNQTLIVQVRGQEWSQVAQIRYHVPSQETSYLAPGEFVGFAYP